MGKPKKARSSQEVRRVKIKWSVSAQSNLDRLHDFLGQHDLGLADETLDRIVDGAASLADFPRRGQRLSEFRGVSVHEFRTGQYLIRYSIGDHQLNILRCFHVREDRL